MTNKRNELHWQAMDYRKESLTQIISGLDSSIKSILKRSKENPWYDGIWVLEDTEPIYGMGFIAFQTYINGSIKDIFETVSNKTEYYKLETEFPNFEKSKVELIVGLANYFKHKEDIKLHGPTKQILECFNLLTSDDFDTNSPIFRGLDLLSQKWDLFEILEIVVAWRRKLYEYFVEKHCL